MNKKYDGHIDFRDYDIISIYRVVCPKCGNEIKLVDHPLDYDDIICKKCNGYFYIKTDEK
jgi:predicted nucleic acid-binding Zn ribbon protein